MSPCWHKTEALLLLGASFKVFRQFGACCVKSLISILKSECLALPLSSLSLSLTPPPRHTHTRTRTDVSRPLSAAWTWIVFSSGWPPPVCLKLVVAMKYRGNVQSLSIIFSHSSEMAPGMWPCSLPASLLIHKDISMDCCDIFFRCSIFFTILCLSFTCDQSRCSSAVQHATKSCSWPLLWILDDELILFWKSLHFTSWYREKNLESDTYSSNWKNLPANCYTTAERDSNWKISLIMWAEWNNLWIETSVQWMGLILDVLLKTQNFYLIYLDVLCDVFIVLSWILTPSKALSEVTFTHLHALMAEAAMWDAHQHQLTPFKHRWHCTRGLFGLSVLLKETLACGQWGPRTEPLTFPLRVDWHHHWATAAVDALSGGGEDD